MSRYGEKIVLAVAGVAVFAFVALLLALNHQAVRDLHTAEQTKFANEVKRRSESLRFFLDDRENDLNDIGMSTPVEAYFLNKGLGMSLRYGLAANLEDIAKSLKRITDTRRFGDLGTIYRRIALFDATGTAVIDVVPGRSVTDAMEPGETGKKIFPVADDPRAHIHLEADKAGVWDLVVHRPLYHKGSLVGQLSAWIDRELFVDRLLPLSYPAAGAAIVEASGGVLGNRYANAILMTGNAAGASRLFTVDLPIESSPFRLIAGVPESILFASGTGEWLIRSLYGLAFLLLLSCIVIWRNASKREFLRRELREAQKLEAVGHLAGGIAHEINTPAQYIGDNLRFLSEARGDLFALIDRSLQMVATARDCPACSAAASEILAMENEIDLEFLRDEVPLAIKQSQDGVAQVSRIVLAMKEFSHPGGHETSAVDLNHAIENVITISRNEWKHVAQIETDLEGGLNAVICHPGEINQVLLNLIVNAAHAIAAAGLSVEEGRIRISTHDDGEAVEIRIDDNGTGIPEAVREKVFNPFFTTKAVGKGTGQGLSIARDIVVNRHGGRIGFETKEGKGTSFHILLPAPRNTQIQVVDPKGADEVVFKTEPMEVLP